MTRSLVWSASPRSAGVPPATRRSRTLCQWPWDEPPLQRATSGFEHGAEGGDAVFSECALARAPAIDQVQIGERLQFAVRRALADAQFLGDGRRPGGSQLGDKQQNLLLPRREIGRPERGRGGGGSVDGGGCWREGRARGGFGQGERDDCA